ncbi:MAG: signal peptidase II [Fusicatenibacter sp.]|nr:signal peptidase II [Lachnospiraceae bacterium]MDY2938791.1 signal peptidase II [Fusicatenibacter sp.]
MICVLLIILIFFGDLCLKRYVEKNLKKGEEIPLFGGRIVARKLHNYGIAGGFFANHTHVVERSTFFVLITLLIGEGVLIVRKSGYLMKMGLAFLLGGGFSNWYDRFRQGFVTDYFSFTRGNQRLRRLVFNLSDFCIFAGTLLVLIGSLISGETKG